MHVFDRLFLWRARRVIKPMLDETARDEEHVQFGSDAWRRWWEERGERELRCILMTAWDPIGVGDTPEAWDEYDGYIAGVATRLRDSASEDAGEVATFLNHVEGDFIGTLNPVAEQRNSLIADTLAAWHEWSFVRAGRPPREWIDDD